MPLPESGLGALLIPDHEAHHQVVHDIHNRLLQDSDKVGDILVKTAAGDTAGSVGFSQPHFVHSSQVKSVTHSVAGALSLALTRDTRAIYVDATQAITDISVTGFELLGPVFAEVWVLVENTSGSAIALTISSSTAVAVGQVPTSIPAGGVTRFRLQRWVY